MFFHNMSFELYFQQFEFINLPLFSLGDQKYKFVEVQAMISRRELGFYFPLGGSINRNIK